MEAELVFLRLILLADDYGRVDGRSKVLRSALFPLRADVTIKRLDKWLAELLLLPAPPLIQYVVDGRPYLELTGWEKHRGKSRRALASKFPACPEQHMVPQGNEYSASPEILGNNGDPPVCKVEGSEGKEAREIPGRSPAIVDPWSLSNPKLILKPIRFKGESRDAILDWAKRRKFGKRVIDDCQRQWEAWGPTKDFRRPVSSWVGSFKHVANGAIGEGTVLLETPDEKYQRELAASPLTLLARSTDAA